MNYITHKTLILCLIVFFFGFSCKKKEEPYLNTRGKIFNVALGECRTIKIDKLYYPNTSSFDAAFGKQNRFWVFTLLRENGGQVKIVGNNFDGLKWKPEATIVPPVNYIECWSAAADSEGNPVLFWISYKTNDPNEVDVFNSFAYGHQVNCTRYTGAKWTHPEIICGHESGSISEMSSFCGLDGIIHLAYRAKMSPPEGYGIGHGQFPSKIFHTYFKGKSWSKPKATTSKGPFDVRNPQFCLSATGEILLSASIHPINEIFGTFKKAYIAYQQWDLNGWSEYEKVADNSSNYCYDVNMATDQKGNIFITWKDSSEQKTARIIDDKLVDMKLLGMESSADVIKDSNNRIYLCWTEKQVNLSVWNGSNRSDLLNIEPYGIVKLYIGPDGKVYLANLLYERRSLDIREIIIEEK